MLANQPKTEVTSSMFYCEKTNSVIKCQLHKTTTQITVYHDSAVLATIEKVAIGYQFDGYIFEMFVEVMDYLLKDNSVVVLAY